MQKPDWFLRLVFVAILLLLAIHEYRTARYVPVGIGGREILDTRTGVAYVQGEHGNYAVNFVKK